MGQDDKKTIAAFVAFRATRDLPGVGVESYPDMNNRGACDIDAVAGPLAIEHTSVDTIANQRRDGAWFAEVIDPLRRELANRIPFRLTLTFPYRGIERGQDWAAMRSALKTWILTKAESLADGRHAVQPAGIPLSVDVVKASERPRGLFFRRWAPDDCSLAERLREQVGRKAAKLLKYGAQGKRGVLLLESSDIALMNETHLVEALRVALPAGLPVAVSELWYADTSIEDDPLFYDFTAAVGRAV